MNSKQENRKVILMIIAVLTVIAAIAGTTYAFFSVAVTSGNYMYGKTGFGKDSLKLEIAQLSAGTGNMIPQLDSGIQGAASGSTGNDTCVDSRGNTICKVYSIKITNQAQVKMNVAGHLILTAATMPNLKWALGTSATTGFPTPSGAYYTKNDTEMGDVTLEPVGFNGSSKTYYVVIWISEQGAQQNDYGLFKGTVNFSGYIVDNEGNETQGITSTFGG